MPLIPIRFACALPECQWVQLVEPPDNYVSTDEVIDERTKTNMHAAGRIALARHLTRDHLAIEIYDHYVLACRQRDFPGDEQSDVDTYR